MNVWAIICELNPLHYGHKHLIDTCRKNGATHVVAILSSNFTQRGEPAILTKSARTQCALSSGFDMIIEIPVVWSMSTAEKYALAGVGIAEALGCVDVLAFGSECGSIKKLEYACNAVLSPEFCNIVKIYLSQGITFAKARELAVKELFGDDISDILCSPNNILAIEYIKALKMIKSKIEPFTVKRIGSFHDSMNISGSTASSSYIRKCIKNGDFSFNKYIPPSTYKIIKYEIYKNHAPSLIENIERAILFKFRTITVNDLINVPDVSEGIENRILKSSRNVNSFDELLNKIKTKRYTLSRIRRIVLCAFLGIDRSLHSFKVQYIRVLGVNYRGIEILSKLKSCCNLPIITSYSQISKIISAGNSIFINECKISDIYGLTFKNVIPCGMEQSYKIIAYKEKEDLIYDI